MNLPTDPAMGLARRLQALRKEGLAGRTITQRQLAEAFSDRESASPPLISSWENSRDPAVPPQSRIEAYATFFATERSVATEPYRVLDPTELTGPEQARRAELLHELTNLREDALRVATEQPSSVPLWQFPDDEEVTIVCADLPEERRTMPYADPENPDYVKGYSRTDLDALIDLYGHVCALNSTRRVTIATPSETRADWYTSHLIVLGGVDWNHTTRELMRHIKLPVEQVARDSDTDPGAFEVREGGETKEFKPNLQEVRSRLVLLEDIAHFYHGPNPFNTARTVTMCNGMYARGTLGAVRALTDPKFQDRNEAYIRARFANAASFSILARVYVVHGDIITPDWTHPRVRLHEWHEELSDRQ